MDDSKHYLGALCDRKHDVGNGQSLRYKRNRSCVECAKGWNSGGLRGPKWKREKGSAIARYGITVEEYEAMRAAQCGVCAICGQHEMRRDLAVDHCHKTNVVRGLLCSMCNGGLGMFRDRPDLLMAARRYLLRTELA